MWYNDYNEWIRDGKCMLLPGGLKPFEKIVPPEIFYFCIQEALRKNECELCRDFIHWSYEANPLQRRMLAAKEQMYFKRIPNSSI